MEELNFLCCNTLNHIVSGSRTIKDSNNHLVTPLSFTINYYLERLIQNSDFKVKHITTTSDFDTNTLIQIKGNYERKSINLNSVLGNVKYTRCFNLEAVYAEIFKANEIPEQFEVIVIEDLSDLFNLEFSKNFTYASSLISKLFMKLRELAQANQSSILIIERNDMDKKYHSKPIGRFVESLYDYELSLVQGSEPVGISNSLDQPRLSRTRFLTVNINGNINKDIDTLTLKI